MLRVRARRPPSPALGGARGRRLRRRRQAERAAAQGARVHEAHEPGVPKTAARSRPASPARARTSRRRSASGTCPLPPRSSSCSWRTPTPGRFVHWSLLRIPATIHYIAEGEPPAGHGPDRERLRRQAVGRPVPARGQGAAPLRVRAVRDRRAARLDASASADDVRSAIAKHAVATGRLIGRFGAVSGRRRRSTPAGCAARRRGARRAARRRSARPARRGRASRAPSCWRAPAAPRPRRPRGRAAGPRRRRAGPREPPTRARARPATRPAP